MMRPFLFLAVIPLLARVDANPLPAVLSSRGLPGSLPVRPGQCVLVAVDCECPTDGKGGHITLCGYVDSNWQIAKRDLESQALSDIAPRQADVSHTPPATAGHPAETGDGKANILIGTLRNLSNAITHYDRVANPEQAAAVALNATLIFPGANTVIRNCDHSDTRGQFVQGIQGVVQQPAAIDNITFEKGSLWQMRWDFTWYGTDGVRPPPYLLGAHIEILVQNTLGGRYNKVFYPSDARAFDASPQPGDYYLTHVLNPLNKLANFDGASQTFTKRTELQNAQAIAAAWLNA